MHPEARTVPLLLTVAALAAGVADGASTAPAGGALPPISAAERALASVPGEPSAPAVVLRKVAAVRFAHGPLVPRSTLDVEVRTKILSEAGKAFGQVAVGHGPGLELVAFEGRTVRSDGSAVELDPEAVFRQAGTDRQATKVAFPAVEVGAIIDYRFQLAWRAPVLPEPWFFDDRVPTLRSELSYETPPGLVVRHHLRETGRAHWQVTSEPTAGGGTRTVLRLADLPSVPDEPSSFPFADLAHAAWLVTERALAADGSVVDVAADWSAASAPYVAAYESARRFGREAHKTARRLTAGEREARRRVDTLFRHLRDRIETTGSTLVVPPGATVDAVLRDGQGSSAEVALLLAEMLEAAEVPAALVWAGDWRDAWPDTEVVRPGWFSRLLVAATIGGEHLFLDAGDRRLAAGRLAPVQEGTTAVLLDPPRAVPVVLPRTPAGGSVRRADLRLELDAGGRIAGDGTLELTGHHAWFFLRRRDSPEAVAEGWRNWLAERFAGFAVAVEDVDERVDESRVTVRWSLAQHASDVLGDEASLAPSLPLGPLEQRYAQPPEERRTPVRVSFADRDELDLTLVWPDAWQLELMPEALAFAGHAGVARAALEIDEGSRRLRYRRTVEIRHPVFYPGPEYASLRDLYRAVQRHDAQPLVLVSVR